MKALLTLEEYEYLCANCRLFNQMIRIPISPSNRNNVILEISDLMADDIRDWAAEKLQICGFDIDYNITKEGVVLESIIDKLYVGN
jgi:hypothetical protein